MEIVITPKEDVQALVREAVRAEVSHLGVAPMQPFTLKQACEFLSKPQETIRRWCRQGVLDARQVGGSMYVTRESVYRYFQTNN